MIQFRTEGLIEDLSYAFNTLSQLLDQPRQTHYDAIVKVVRYIKAFVGACSSLALIHYS